MWNEDGQQEKGSPTRGPPWDLIFVLETRPHCCSQEETIGVLGCHLVANRNVVDQRHQDRGPRADVHCWPERATWEDGTHVLQTNVRRLLPGCGNDASHHCSKTPTWSPRHCQVTWAGHKQHIGPTGPERHLPPSRRAPQTQPTQANGHWATDPCWCLGWLCGEAVPIS